MTANSNVEFDNEYLLDKFKPFADILRAVKEDRLPELWKVHQAVELYKK